MTKYCLQGPESQKGARQLLENALVENRFPQAVLIEGERGIGKKALAIELAKTLLASAERVRNEDVRFYKDILCFS